MLRSKIFVYAENSFLWRFVSIFQLLIRFIYESNVHKIKKCIEAILTKCRNNYINLIKTLIADAEIIIHTLNLWFYTKKMQ